MPAQLPNLLHCPPVPSLAARSWLVLHSPGMHPQLFDRQKARHHTSPSSQLLTAAPASAGVWSGGPRLRRRRGGLPARLPRHLPPQREMRSPPWRHPARMVRPWRQGLKCAWIMPSSQRERLHARIGRQASPGCAAHCPTPHLSFPLSLSATFALQTSVFAEPAVRHAGLVGSWLGTEQLVISARDNSRVGRRLQALGRPALPAWAPPGGALCAGCRQGALTRGKGALPA